MTEILLNGLRYTFLILFYLFLFKISKSLMRELRRQSKAKGSVSVTENEASLVVLASENENLTVNSTLPLKAETFFGRSKKCQVLIEDHFVSAQHAKITYADGQYWLEDLNSLNGTYLNELRLLEKTQLKNSDVISIGGAKFEFVRWAYEVEPNNGCGTGERG